MVSEVTTTDSDDRLDRDARVYASSNNGCGSFRSVNKVVGNFGTAQGWQFDKHGKPVSGDDRKTLARLTSGARTGTKSDSARRD